MKARAVVGRGEEGARNLSFYREGAREVGVRGQ